MILFFILRNLIQILTGAILFIWLILAGYSSGQLQYYFWALLVLGLMAWMLRGKMLEMRGRR
jgi:hypothetical protein